MKRAYGRLPVAVRFWQGPRPTRGKSAAAVPLREIVFDHAPCDPTARVRRSPRGERRRRPRLRHPLHPQHRRPRRRRQPQDHLFLRAVSSRGRAQRHRHAAQVRVAQVLRGRRQRRRVGRHRLRGPSRVPADEVPRRERASATRFATGASSRQDDKIFVDYTFTASYKIPGDKGVDVWRRKVDDNRLELVPYKDEFRILAGM